MNKYILTFGCIIALLFIGCKKEIGLQSAEQESPSLERFSAAYLALRLDTAKVCRIVLPSTQKLADTATAKDKLWRGRTSLSVSFLGGSETLKAKVMTYASKWSETSGIKLQTASSNGDIRVSFDGDSGSWSYIGTDALQVNINQPTMNYGWLTDQSSDEEVSKIVLHEFGHALGFIHEHQRPNADVDWNTSAVYAYYEGYPNYWTQEEVNAYVLHPNGSTQLVYNAKDENTIMNFPVSPALANRSAAVKNNVTLSAGDQGLISFIYPTVNAPRRLNFNK